MYRFNLFFQKPICYQNSKMPENKCSNLLRNTNPHQYALLFPFHFAVILITTIPRKSAGCLCPAITTPVPAFVYVCAGKNALPQPVINNQVEMHWLSTLHHRTKEIFSTIVAGGEAIGEEKTICATFHLHSAAAQRGFRVASQCKSGRWRGNIDVNTIC